MTTNSRGVIAILAATVAMVAFASAASAHGVLEGSSPSANASLAAPPPQLVLRFSEPVVPTLSTAAVLDRDGRVVSGRSAVAEGGRTIAVSVLTLNPGVYTVKWHVLSAVDGHTTSGFYVFAVGESVPVGTAFTRAAPPSTPLVAARWVGFVAAMLVAGAAFFQHLVITPGLITVETEEASRLRIASEATLRALTMASALVLLLSLVVEFVLQALMLFGTSLAGFVGTGVLGLFLTGTKAGWSALLRASMAVIFLLPLSRRGRVFRMAALIWVIVIGTIVALLMNPGTVAGSSHLLHLAVILLVATVYGLVSAMAAIILPLVPDLRLPEGAWVPPVAGTILLAGFTVSSHAAGVSSLAVLLDWVHLLAAGVWIGGLASLLLVLATAAPAVQSQLSRILVPRFSRLAGISLGVLILTGIYSAWVHIPALQAFTITAYGRTLLVKILLVAPLIVLGVLNRFVLRPRLASGRVDGFVLRRFLRSIGAEVVLGGAVFLVVAVLTITPPATVTMPAVAREPLILAGEAGDLQIRLTITPAVAGWNRLEVTVPEGQDRSVGTDTRVLLRLVKLDENLNPITIALQPQPQGHYVAEGGELGLPGWWEVEVVVRRRGKFDVSTTFPILLGKPPARTSHPEALSLLEEARKAMGAIRSWREVQQITNGSGGVIVTHFEALRPDRLRYRTSAGLEAVIIGATRYIREGNGPWARDTSPQPLILGGPNLEYLRDATAVALGRQTRCDGEPCQVVMWEIAPASFAARIGLTSYRIYSILMVAPSHYMISRSLDLNAPLEITPP